MILSCVIIDDEPLAAELLKSYAEKTPFLQLKGVFHNAISAMQIFREEPIDLVFLDIQMPELSGIELAKIMPRQTKFIFTTAFSQYAVEGFKVKAVDYLLKPISYDNFVASAMKVVQLKMEQTPASSRERFFFVKSDYQLLRINIDEIVYIEGQKDYVRIYLDNGTKVMALLNMKTLEDTLPHPEFLRTHRSFIVNMSKVKNVVRFRIVIGDKLIPISDSYKDRVQQYLEERTLG